MEKHELVNYQKFFLIVKKVMEPIVEGDKKYYPKIQDRLFEAHKNVAEIKGENEYDLLLQYLH